MSVTVSIHFAWYDIWLGVYFDRGRRCAYVCLVPMLPIVFQYVERAR